MAIRFTPLFLLLFLSPLAFAKVDHKQEAMDDVRITYWVYSPFSKRPPQAVMDAISLENEELSKLYERLAFTKVEEAKQFIESEWRYIQLDAHRILGDSNQGEEGEGFYRLGSTDLNQLINLKVRLQVLLMRSHKFDGPIDESRLVPRRDRESEHALLRGVGGWISAGFIEAVVQNGPLAIPLLLGAGLGSVYIPRLYGKARERFSLIYPILPMREGMKSLLHRVAVNLVSFKTPPELWLGKFSKQDLADSGCGVALVK